MRFFDPSQVGVVSSRFQVRSGSRMYFIWKKEYLSRLHMWISLDVCYGILYYSVAKEILNCFWPEPRTSQESNYRFLCPMVSCHFPVQPQQLVACAAGFFREQFFSPTRTNLEKTPGGVISLNRKCTITYNQYSSGQKNNASRYVIDTHTHKQLNEEFLVHVPLLSIVYGFQSVSNVARSL